MYYYQTRIFPDLIRKILFKCCTIIILFFSPCLIFFTVYAAPILPNDTSLDVQSGSDEVGSTPMIYIDNNSASGGPVNYTENRIGTYKVGDRHSNIGNSPFCDVVFQSVGSIEHMAYHSGYHVIILDNSQDLAVYRWLKFNYEGGCINFPLTDGADIQWVEGMQRIRDFKFGTKNQLAFFIADFGSNDEDVSSYKLVEYYMGDGFFSIIPLSGVVSFFESQNEQYVVTSEQLFIRTGLNPAQFSPISLELEKNEKIVKADITNSMLFFLTVHPVYGWRIKAFDRVYNEEDLDPSPVFISSKVFLDITVTKQAVHSVVLTLSKNQVHLNYVAGEYNSSLQWIEDTSQRGSIVYWNTYSMEGKLEANRVFVMMDYTVKVMNFLLIERPYSYPIQLELIGMGSRNGYPWKSILPLKHYPASETAPENTDEYDPSEQNDYKYLYVLLPVICILGLMSACNLYGM